MSTLRSVGRLVELSESEMEVLGLTASDVFGVEDFDLEWN